MGLSQALGQEFSGSVGKFGASVGEYSASVGEFGGSVGKFGATLLMNSLENSIKGNYFISPRDHPIFVLQPNRLNFNPLCLG